MELAMAACLAASGCAYEDGNRGTDLAGSDGFPGAAAKQDGTFADGVVLVEPRDGFRFVETSAGGVACAASGACIAVVVIGAVFVGGVVLLAMHAKNPAEQSKLQGRELQIELDNGLVTAGQSVYQGAFDAREAAIDGLFSPGSSTPIREIHRFAAVTYSWKCEEFGGGYAPCLDKAADFLSCASHGGGEACWEPIGGFAQYQSHSSSNGSSVPQSGSDPVGEQEDDYRCPGVSPGSPRCNDIISAYKSHCSDQQWQTLGCWKRDEPGDLPTALQTDFNKRTKLRWTDCGSIRSMAARGAKCEVLRSYYKHSCVAPDDWDDGHDQAIEHASNVYEGCFDAAEAVPTYAGKCTLPDFADWFDELYDEASAEVGC